MVRRIISTRRGKLRTIHKMHSEPFLDGLMLCKYSLKFQFTV
jgi:hypothetical protein